MKNMLDKISSFFIRNWFKLVMISILFLFLLIIHTGIDVNIYHRGFINSNYDAIDGSTIWSNFEDVNY